MILKSNPLLVSFQKNINVIALVLFLGLLSSCVTQRRVEYLQDRNKNAKSFKEAEFPDYRLKPNDELYIQINSLDEAAASVFSNNRQESNYVGSIQPYGASLMSYSVDKDGYLLLPVIGKILVKDKTLSEITVILKDSLNHILNQPVVTVKLVNRYVSVLGEVRNPGHFPYSQDKLTIYDALGLAGDITDYGNRTKVMLIRNENGENIRINVNLNKSEILSSDYFYLRPNDIVYVVPLRNKFWGMRQFPFEILFSALTTALLFYSIFK
jgi:polysaccharide export outer membrane protein